MLVLITYDISNNKRRSKLHKTLKNYGQPVQFSVFECFLDKKDLVRLQKEVISLIKKDEDSIIYYSLCENCLNRIYAIRKTPLPHRIATIII